MHKFGLAAFSYQTLIIQWQTLQTTNQRRRELVLFCSVESVQQIEHLWFSRVCAINLMVMPSRLPRNKGCEFPLAACAQSKCNDATEMQKLSMTPTFTS